MMNNYIIFHCHTMLSNPTTTMDSVNSFKDYVDRAKELNMKGLCISEHGNIYEWLHKKEYIEKNNMKYIHGIEAYITESLDNKQRDNYHCILISKNYKGFLELNELISKSFNRSDVKVLDDIERFYYQPRILYQELKNTSDNILITTACLGGILGNGSVELKKDFVDFLSKNKHRCFLEIQHHNVSQQAELNKVLVKISNTYDIPLIAGTDTHYLNDIYADGRRILQESKNIYFDNEDGWDLSFKSYDELVVAYKNQNAIDEKYYLQAIDNTNVLYEIIEEFKLDRSNKYPKLYKDSNKVLLEKIKQHIKNSNIKIDRSKKERIEYEFKTYIKNGAVDYLLLEDDIKSWCRENGVEYGYSRGSVSGSYIAYLLKITYMDSIKHNLSFERFMNPERISLSDVDTDYPPSQRGQVKEYIYNKIGLYCADIITFNTIADKGAIRDVGRGLKMDLEEINQICNRFDNGEENTLRKEYPKLFKYVDLLKGVITSVSFHPCGTLVSPFPIEGVIGTFSSTTNKYPITQLNMKELDSLNFVKLDLLGLDSIELINETCKLAGIERLTPDNIDENDEKVWNSIHDSGLLVFQWEGDYAHSYYKKLFSKETIYKIKARNPNFKYIDLFSVGNGAIRPAGDSYRDALSNGEFNDNGHKALNELLKSTNNFLVFQEQIIEFLNKFCGFTLGEADLVRRGFAKKTGTEQYLPKIIEGFIKTMQENYNTSKEEAEKIIVNFINVIQDASDYLFSINHAQAYSYIGYICAYLRYYYPLEFLTVGLNINQSNMDKTVKIIEYINKFTNIKIKPIEFGKSQAIYSFDKSNNIIYKGILSIKFLNSQVADELYQLAQENKYTNFVDLIKDIKEKTSTDSRKLRILTGLNFFSEFGKNKKLLEILDLYETIGESKQIKKEKAEKLGLNIELLLKYTEKETEKVYKNIDIISYIKDISGLIEDKSLSVKEQVKFEFEFLEYTTVKYSKADKSLYIVTEYKVYKDKTKPYITLRNLKTGEDLKTKVKNGKYFSENPFKLFNVLQVLNFKIQKKTKNIGGQWVKTDEDEQILDEWVVY